MNTEVTKINIARNLAAKKGLLSIYKWLKKQNSDNRDYKEHDEDMFRHLIRKTNEVHASIKKAEASAVFGGPVKKCKACIGAGGILTCAGDHESWDTCWVCKGTGFSLIKS